ncbi:H-type small acid-soluble spore protein [Alicyclobacillus macrosporangiidus]|uniref:Small acid-soluble spore protein, H-type n=1 Tax=Alicyclobacillus macrosporangiidus TaxID=392015 RepID=A0A1I7GH03_9BACL|nr:H-type small acid-soluble spore protein [Alicyclobacillus macrosporangiidus]SFU47695.1 small acid-soluble spore protein, H-type [Alicyclobacillus macrosporangiidus]
MTLQQAKEIVNSPENVVVLFEGKPVWIDELDDATGTALVHVETDGKPMRVHVNRLHAQ